MTEPAGEGTTGVEPAGVGLTAGAMLKAAREKQGRHIAALAAAIKVSPRKLEALEADRWAELPDATFIRALALTVCRTLKVDPLPVLERLPPANTGLFLPGRSVADTPFRDRPGRVEPGLSGFAFKPLIWAAAVLVVAALSVLFWPQHWWPVPDAGERPAALVPSTAAPVADLADASASAPASGSAPVAAPAASQPSAQPVSGSSAAPTPTAAAVAETVFSAPAAGVAGADLGTTGLLSLRTAEASWLEVRDGRGQILLSRTVFPGETVGLDGALPLRLTVGNVAATQLVFRGRPVDLASRARDNVARFDLQ